MNTEIRIDTVRLRTHIELIECERRYAQELCNHLHHIHALSDDTICTQIASMIQKAEFISRYCVSMSEALNETCCIFEKLSKDISDILNDYVAQNRLDK